MDIKIKYILTDLPTLESFISNKEGMVYFTYSLNEIQLEEWIKVPKWFGIIGDFGNQLELIIKRAYELHSYLIWFYDKNNDFIFKYISIFKERLN